MGIEAQTQYSHPPTSISQASPPLGLGFTSLVIMDKLATNRTLNHNAQNPHSLSSKMGPVMVPDAYRSRLVET